MWETQEFRQLSPLDQEASMFHKIKDVVALPDMQLSVQFANGTTKIYDVKPLISAIPVFSALEDHALFSSVNVDTDGYGIV